MVAQSYIAIEPLQYIQQLTIYIYNYVAIYAVPWTAVVVVVSKSVETGRSDKALMITAISGNSVFGNSVILMYSLTFRIPEIYRDK